MNQYTVIGLIITLWIAGINGFITYEKGFNFWGWFILSFFLGGIFVLPFALIVRRDEIALQEREIRTGRAKQCPWCQSLAHPYAIICPMCQRSFSEPPRFAPSTPKPSITDRMRGVQLPEAR